MDFTTNNGKEPLPGDKGEGNEQQQRGSEGSGLPLRHSDLEKIVEATLGRTTNTPATAKNISSPTDSQEDKKPRAPQKANVDQGRDSEGSVPLRPSDLARIVEARLGATNDTAAASAATAPTGIGGANAKRANQKNEGVVFFRPTNDEKGSDSHHPSEVQQPLDNSHYSRGGEMEIPGPPNLDSSASSNPGAYSGTPGGVLIRARAPRFSLFARSQADDGNDPMRLESGENRDYGSWTLLSVNNNKSTDEFPSHSASLPMAEAVESQHLEEAEPVEEKTTRLAAKTAAVVGVLVIVVLGIVLLVVLLIGDDAKSVGTDSSKVASFPTPAPSLSTASYIQSLLPPSTLREIQLDPDSPQSMAFQWLQDDPSLSNYTEERMIQRLVLAILYFSTGGDKWYNSTNWLSYIHHECTWFTKDSFGTNKELTAFFGVQEFPLVYDGYSNGFPCEGESEIMRHLWLDGNELTGTVPEEFFLLTSLKSFSMVLNGLTGTISSKIQQLTNLEAIAFFKTDLSGTIPTQVGLLTNLSAFFLGNNQLTGSMPTELGLLTQLRWIQTEENEITGTIPSEIGNLSHLHWFLVYDNQLSGSIPTTFGQLSSLWILYLDQNQNLTGTIPSEIGSVSTLYWLDCYDTSLSGTIPSVFSALPMLAHLRLEDTQLTGTIPSQLGLLSNLQRLYLNETRVSGTIPATLSRLATNGSLLELNVSNTRLSGAVPTDLCPLVDLAECEYLLCGCNCTCSGDI